ncbi:FGGY family carbohydrate kinase [Nocardioides sp. TF02-7]|uniref:FGGY family carbohydrate kinase n=1 Tax=Nocardioides sp. TF02-7 TaxID=2917724 RepID=UPI001F0519CD|nr:FGGY family carbohydrate kinase [Nocardioides sp. TF02-7]UMG94492.1 hypothetical protein MF408_11250 [Nocardioides sp. TF02-7]
MSVLGPSLRVAAVDLGATSGRVMSGRVTPGRVEVDERHRFPNGAVRVGQSYFWDVLGIHREVLAGVREVVRTGPLHGVGIDSWAIDYGLLDRDGQLLGNPFSHRDPRTDGVAARVVEEVGAAELYGTTGIQQLPFNTIYQLHAARGTAALEAAEHLLLLPDLLGYWLTGSIGAERTNASTTQLYDVRTGEWAVDLARRLGLPWGILPPLRDPGAVVGPLLPARRPGGRGRTARCRWWPSDPTTPPRRSSPCRPSRRRSPTSPPAPGRWSGSSSTSRCSARPPGWRTSPTSSASTAPSGSSRT